MKNFRYGSCIGLFFISLYIINFGLVTAAVISTNYLLISLAIVLSCLQFYLHDRFISSHQTLKNYPFGYYLKDLVSFVPKWFATMFLKVPYTNTELTKNECLVLARRAKRKMPIVVEDNLLSKNDPGFEYLHTYPAFMALSPSDLRVQIGAGQCSRPYSLSVYNFGALDHASFGKESIHALSQAAGRCGCAVNSGEKGIAPELVRGGGDIIWQINPDAIDECTMRDIAGKPYIKMIELRMCASQISEPQYFAEEVCTLIDKLHTWSGGKPVGIKLIKPSEENIEILLRWMVSSGACVDYISIEESYVPTRLLHKSAEQCFFEAVFATKMLINKFKLPTKVIATGIILTEYDILRLCALGADACFGAAGTLMKNGLLTQQFLRPSSPCVRLANFQRNTIEATRRLMQRCGYEHVSEADPADFFRRVSAFETLSLKDIFGQTERKMTAAPQLHLN